MGFCRDAAGELRSWSLTARRSTCSIRIGGSILGLVCFVHCNSMSIISQIRNGVFQIFDLTPTGLLIQSAPRVAFCTGAYTFCRMAALPATHTPEHSGAILEASNLHSSPTPVSSATLLATSVKESALESNSAGGPTRKDQTTADHSASAVPFASEADVNAVACPGEHPACVEIRSIQSGTCLAVLQPPDSEKFGMSMSLVMFRKQLNSGARESSSGSSILCLAVGYEDGRLAVWGLAGLAAVEQQQQQPMQLQQPLMCAKLHNEPVMALAVDPLGAGGISGSAEKTAVCFTLDFENKSVVPSKTTELAKEGISDIAVRADGRLFVTAGWDGRLRIYNRKKVACLAILKYHTASATAIAFSRTNMLASASRDYTVALWDMYR